MAFFGGDLGSHESFKNILSIGYEFETHDLAKLSLSDNELVNSSLTSRDMSKKLKDESASNVDDNNYEVIDEESELYYTEYFDEYDGVANDYVFMNITNDIGTGNFDSLLKKNCKKYEDANKNDLYVYKSDKGEEYNIRFDSLLSSQECSVISGVEYLITYLKIKKTKNIILETFLNACNRIFTHLHGIKKIPGQLFIKDPKTGKEKVIGHLENRILYEKPNTNVFYLQTHDTEYFTKDYSIGMVGFLPQMTFRANIKHVISIMKDILHNTDLKKKRNTKRMLEQEYNQVLDIEQCLEDLFKTYNETTETKKISKTLKNQVFGYFFMIFYKIYMYMNSYITSDTSEEENYFKNHLTFSARHNNFMFYEKIKEIMSRTFKNDTVNTIIALLNQPKILAKYIYTSRSQRKALKTVLEPGEEGYGDPSVSFISYFNHFEESAKRENSSSEEEEEKQSEEDWFLNADVDVFSTHFKMPDDGSVIIENRLFFKELVAFANDNANVYAPVSFSLNNLKNVYRKLITTGKVDDLSKKELNPNTLNFVNKCKKGQYRDEDFKCKTKSKPKTKKTKGKPKQNTRKRGN